MTLPSERTLRDYTNYFKNKPGFQDEVDQQLLDEIPKVVSESRRYVAVLDDEMKVNEGLIFSKHSGEIIGFINLGNINDELLRLETGEQPAVAKQILVLMVRGLLFTRGVTADVHFPIVWEAIHQLEAHELKVLCVTSMARVLTGSFSVCTMLKRIPLLTSTKHKTYILQKIVGSTSYQIHPI